MNQVSNETKCECCGASGATLLCRWAAHLCKACSDVLSDQGEKGDEYLQDARNARQRAAQLRAKEAGRRGDDANVDQDPPKNGGGTKTSGSESTATEIPERTDEHAVWEAIR